jgi:MYXO-CTERM domain-containing protein
VTRGGVIEAVGLAALVVIAFGVWAVDPSANAEVPVLVVIALAVGLYGRWRRRRGVES